MAQELKTSVSLTKSSGDEREVGGRRLWLPWRPRMRLVYPLPRLRALIFQASDAYGTTVGRRLRSSALGRLVSFLLLIPVCIFVIPFAVGVVILGGFGGLIVSADAVLMEWMALILLSPFSLMLRLVGAVRWVLRAHAGAHEWTTHVRGWRASEAALDAARQALARDEDLPTPPWRKVFLRSTDWILL
jgi:hypothetical protein